MLYLDSPVEIGRVTLFRDYSNANRYYYLPNSPRLAMEGGEPKFELLIFRRDITDNPLFKEGDRPGGGFLTMTVDLGISEDALNAIRGQLRRRTGGVVEPEIASVTNIFHGVPPVVDADPPDGGHDGYTFTVDGDLPTVPDVPAPAHDGDPGY